jgi:hypothetical protein
MVIRNEGRVRSQARGNWQSGQKDKDGHARFADEYSFDRNVDEASFGHGNIAGFPINRQKSYELDESAISHTLDRDGMFFSPDQSGMDGIGHSKVENDDSALNARAVDDQELSQILNPNLERIIKTEPLQANHPGTQKSQMFLRKNFLLVETMMNKMKKKQASAAWKSIKTQTSAADSTISDLRKRIDRKKRRKEGLKKLGQIANIYRRQVASRAISYWVDAMQRWKENDTEQQRLIQVLVVMLSYKAKELSRIAMVKLRNLEHILDKEREEKQAREKQKELDKAESERSFTNLHELLRRLAQMRQKDGFHKIMQEAMNPYGGPRRKNGYAVTAATMLMAHLIEKEFDREKRNALQLIRTKYDYELNYPNAQRLSDGFKATRRVLSHSQQRVFGKKLISYLKIKHHWAIRKSMSRMFEGLVKAERRVKMQGLRSMFTKNINMLKYQKLCNYFSGLFSKLVASQRRRNLQTAMTNMKHEMKMNRLRKHNTRLLVSRLTNMLFKTKQDAFTKINLVPAVQELFNFERDKYERSVKLRGALKIGNSFSNYYRKFLFERVRKTLHFLRRFNHKFKTPAYMQRLENFRTVYDDRRKESLHEAFQRLKSRSTLYLLQRYFRDNVDLRNGLNRDVVFALEHNVPSKNDHLNRMVEFWNTTFDLEDIPVGF